MGLRSQFPGVEQHGHTLRVSFTFEGKRCRELTGWEPTPANWARAAKLRTEVQRAIRAGTFNYVAFFPNSKHAAARSHLFADVAQDWLDSLELAKSTLDNYERIINTHWMPKLGALPVRDVTPGALKKAIKGRNFQSAKTRNNAVSVLRMVFEYAKQERLIAESPAEKLGHQKSQKAPPDPFSVAEMRKILEWLQKHSKAQTYHYFCFAFFSGLRTSEILALQWERVDLNAGLVRVNEALVLGEVKPTKTYEMRDVELNPEARAALLAQKAHTYLAFRHVFLNPNTGEPYYNHQAPWLALRACLKALGIRHRPAYNTRHTFATMNLMAGASPFWVSKQLGHKKLEMTMSAYASWIQGADHGREVGKLAAFLGQSLGQKGAAGGNGE
jgi:integrase